MNTPLNKLASFPLDAYKNAPDDQVIFGTGSWALTVGDVRAAAAGDRAGDAGQAAGEPT
jgi:hypothetical protein